MPFVRIDDDGMEVSDEENGSYTGPFSYHAAEEVAYKPQTFDPAALTGVPAAIYHLLPGVNVTQFIVRYDGGHDEGFAHAHGGQTSEGLLLPIEELVTRLATPQTVDSLRKLGTQDSDDPRQKHMIEYYARLSSDELVRNGLDELAEEMTSCLLGRGYGTGEYSMYGQFVADLPSGSLIDDPSAEQPPGKTFD